MVYLLYALFILSCLTLIASVLLQPGKSDAGALFTSSVSSTAFGPRGTLNILSKITIGAAVVFMLSAFLLGHQALTGNRSVLESGALPASSPAAAADVNANANANSAVTTDNVVGTNGNVTTVTIPPAANGNVTTVTVPPSTNTNPAATNANAAASNASAGKANAAANQAANSR